MTVPEDFAKKGGTIEFSYTYTPEKGKDDKTEPEPVEAKTSLNITLIVPDETVFKIMKEPTFTEAGYAENIKGVRKDLEAFNMTDYDYEEKASNGIAIFTHKSSGLVIKKAITDSLMIYNTEGRRFDYNNINCHFSADIESLRIAFNNESFVLTAAGEQPVAFGALTGSAVEFQSGEFSLKGTIKATKIVVKSKVKVSLTGSISADEMLAEKDSELNITVSGSNGIIIGAYGFARLYGTATFNDPNGGKTAIEMQGGSSLEINADSRITVINCWMSVGTFNPNKDGLKLAYLRVPEDSVTKSGSIYMGDDCIFDISQCQEKWLCNIEKQKVSDVDYMLITAPSKTKTGLARDPEGKDIVLPVLNFNDYKASIASDTLTFVHKETNLTVANLQINVAETVIGDLTVNYSEETGYKFTIAENKTVALEGTITISSLTLSGEGVLSITGKANFTNLTVESESTLNFTAIDGDDFKLLKDGVARLYGTVNIVGAAGKTGVTGNPNVKIYLSDTTRFTITNVACSLGYFSGNVAEITIYYPSTATSNDYNRITSAKGDLLFSVAGWVKNVAFVKES